jgi:hypothetical protein
MAPLISEVIDDSSALQYRKDLGDSDFFDARRAVVKGCAKENILHELSVLGIESGTIYKSIEEKQTKKVKPHLTFGSTLFFSYTIKESEYPFSSSNSFTL